MWQSVKLFDRPHIYRIDVGDQAPVAVAAVAAEDGGDDKPPPSTPTSETVVTLWLSDLRRLWCERSEFGALLQRLREANPMVGFDDGMVAELLLERGLSGARHERIVLDGGDGEQAATASKMAEAADADVGGQPEEELLIVGYKAYVAGVPFRFSWRMQLQGADVFFAEITSSLVSNLLEANDRSADLVKIIRGKDRYIQKYESIGLTLDRKGIAAVPFSADWERDRNRQAHGFGRLFGAASAPADECRAVLAQLCPPPAAQPPPAEAALEAANGDPAPMLPGARGNAAGNRLERRGVRLGDRRGVCMAKMLLTRRRAPAAPAADSDDGVGDVGRPDGRSVITFELFKSSVNEEDGTVTFVGTSVAAGARREPSPPPGAPGAPAVCPLHPIPRRKRRNLNL